MDHEKQREILRAALDVFLRYGFRRTTMGDIASAAGVSRPALYLLFANKEAIFRAVVERGMADILREVEAALRARSSLDEQLLQAFEIWSVRPFALVARAPAAEELMASSYDFVADVFERASDHMGALLSDVLRAACARPEALKPAAKSRAKILLAALHGFKKMARSSEEMRALVEDLVAITVASLPLDKKGGRRSSQS